VPGRDAGTEHLPGAMTVAVVGYYVRACRDATAVVCAVASTGPERPGDTVGCDGACATAVAAHEAAPSPAPVVSACTTKPRGALPAGKRSDDAVCASTITHTRCTRLEVPRVAGGGQPVWPRRAGYGRPCVAQSRRQRSPHTRGAVIRAPSLKPSSCCRSRGGSRRGALASETPANVRCSRVASGRAPRWVSGVLPSGVGSMTPLWSLRGFVTLLRLTRASNEQASHSRISLPAVEYAFWSFVGLACAKHQHAHILQQGRWGRFFPRQ
jgi:hypothetical protein